VQEFGAQHASNAGLLCVFYCPTLPPLLHCAFSSSLQLQEAARAARIQAEADQIKAQEAALQVAAAKAEAQLQRAELVEKAKEVEQQQAVTKAAGSFMDLLGLTEADLGLSK
jgi:hypothetical protein